MCVAGEHFLHDPPLGYNCTPAKAEDPPSAEALDRRNESECIIPEEGKSFFGSNASKPDVHIAEEPIFEKLNEFLESRKNRKRKNNTPVNYGKPQEEKRRAFSRKRPKCETACLDEESDLSHEVTDCEFRRCYRKISPNVLIEHQNLNYQIVFRIN